MLVNYSKCPQRLRTIVLVVLSLIASCSDSNSMGESFNSTSDEHGQLSCEDSAAGKLLPLSIPFEIVASYPHSRSAFTQGLDYQDGILYESTGLYGQSTLTKTRLDKRQILAEIKLQPELFGEGATLYGNEVIQLTWKSGKVFRYRAEDLTLVNEHRISGEGWGITYNHKQLITSNGSATLTYHNPDTFEPEQQLLVRFAGRPLKNINELEWVDGCLLANIWQTDTIAVINPESGTTVYTIDLGGLAKKETQQNPNHVANGIAWRDDNNTLLVTGKNWPRIYELRLKPNNITSSNERN